MYNRYIPQSDGSYRKQPMPEPVPPGQPPQTAPPGEVPALQESPPPRPAPGNPPGHQNAGSFLKRLLPQGLDTGDLLIMTLLLLMAGDRPENKNTALLTLALYLFL